MGVGVSVRARVWAPPWALTPLSPNPNPSPNLNPTLTLAPHRVDEGEAVVESELVVEQQQERRAHGHVPGWG